MLKRKVNGILMGAGIIACLMGQTVMAEELSGNSVIENTTQTSVEYKASTYGIITAPSGLNLRSEASQSAKVLTTVRKGSKVEIIQKGSNWHKVRYNSVVGYMSSQWINLVNSGENVAMGDYKIANTGGSGVNLRERPSTSARIITGLREGTVVSVVTTSNGWSKVNVNGKTGYIYSKYLSKTSTSTGTNTGAGVTGDISYSAKGVVCNTNGSGLNLRTKPTTTSSVQLTLKENTSLEIVAKNGSWYKVKAAGKVGYVSNKYVKLGGMVDGDNGSNDVQHSSKGYVHNTNGTGVNLRVNATTSAAVILTIPEGANVEIVAKNNGWYKVRYANRVGYAFGKYIKEGTNAGGSGEVVGNKYEKVLSIMKSQIGSPYVWGGNGEYITDSSIATLRKRFPDANRKGWYDKIPYSYYNKGYRAFDCSSLMQWSFAQVGVRIGRTTYDQLNNGVAVNPSSAKPGDLLFYDNKGHVGMYIGNGKWIEAPYSGEYVRIANVPWNRIKFARRIM